jgi:hypothetical protein
MKKLLPFAAVALMIPSVALAKGPNPNAGTHSNHGKAIVMYVLKGTIYGTGYDSATSTPGSVTITVTHSNRHGKLLVGQSIPVTVGANTKVVLDNGVAAIATSQPGDQGMVKIRAPRMAFKGASSTALQTAMQNQSAHMVIDMGPASSS